MKQIETCDPIPLFHINGKKGMLYKPVYFVSNFIKRQYSHFTESDLQIEAYQKPIS
jgi:hypothetical protein